MPRPTARRSPSLRERLARMQGSTVQHDLQAYDAVLVAANEREAALAALDEGALSERARRLRDTARTGAEALATRAEAAALVREAARRSLGVRVFDEQVVAGLALHDGAVAEMQTGEGKTLAAVLPAFLAALAGRGVHVLTFNDYLARRDAAWMGPVYARLGLSVAAIESGMAPAERRRAYQADITYVTAKEAGFDHLRDGLAMALGDQVHRPFHCAIVDEADSLLVDEARVPLVIAGHQEGRAVSVVRLAEVVAGLERGTHFDTDEHGRNVELTEQGFVRVEQELACPSLHSEESGLLLAELNCALHARVLLHRDVDYIVRDGRIGLVDEFTGRVVVDRHWPDGLQAALEAKEGLARGTDGRILGSMTLQHFLRLYPRLCGMTGTAQDAARELHELYGLGIVVIPTHRPMIRRDLPDVIYTHREAKEQALVEEIQRAHATRRPVLAGTASVAESETLAARLRGEGVACEVLNARDDAREAEIVAGAGALGAVTIATNMAGRGTDIRLGGAAEADRNAVVALGGLFVLGTSRHVSRRVDLQLRGRAGRQGDPGESRLFVALDDELLVRFGLRELIPERFLPVRQDAPVENAALRREVARAQRIVEGQDFEIRRTLWRYAWPIEEQRQAVQARRQALLSGEEEPALWRGSGPRYDALALAVGEDALRRAERDVTLHHLDRGWSEHLAFVAELREGIHLVRLGGDDPLHRFKVLASEAFRRMEDDVGREVVAALSRLEAHGGRLDPSGLGIKGPSATWTYLINDDPFRNQLGALLIGPGHATFAVGAALFALPLFLLMGLVDRYVKKRPRRR